MSNSIKVEEGSENIFKDLGFSDEVAEKELLKAQLGAEIFRILKERKLTQGEAAKLLGVKHLDISRLKAAKLSDYSVDRLMTFLNRLNHDIEIHIIPSQEREGHQRVVAVELSRFSISVNEPWGKPSDETNPDAS
jgi:predicted XRE-type DNA-binding protein